MKPRNVYAGRVCGSCVYADDFEGKRRGRLNVVDIQQTRTAIRGGGFRDGLSTRMCDKHFSNWFINRRANALVWRNATPRHPDRIQVRSTPTKYNKKNKIIKKKNNVRWTRFNVQCFTKIEFFIVFVRYLSLFIARPSILKTARNKRIETLLKR